jgi:phosphoglucosamine mutase
MAKLFGTDGIRGEANRDLSPVLVYNVGRAAASVLSARKKSPKDEKIKILIGRDTRISGAMIESAICAGVCSMGGDVFLADVVPTPAVAYLTRKFEYDAGIVISASHNKFGDNGIKIFNRKGFKLKDELENEIEEIIFDEAPLKNPPPEKIGTRQNISMLGEYIKFLDPEPFGGIKIVADCANGATCEAAKIIFKDQDVIFAEPNGININDDCGSTHMENLRKRVLQVKADIGVAYDGDGDRCLLIDENGKTVNGDEILSICANRMKETGTLRNNGFVATVMSNLGLFKMADRRGLFVDKTPVGDRYVLERMLERGYNLGGEQSGHVIFLDRNTTGDGILTSLQILKIMRETGKSLSQLNQYMKMSPQVVINVNIPNDVKVTILHEDEVSESLAALEEKFKDLGRVLVRPSGTEPLIRVMIESDDIELMNAEAKKFAELILTCAEKM